jgi:hypothetical protein
MSTVRSEFLSKNRGGTGVFGSDIGLWQTPRFMKELAANTEA